MAKVKLTARKLGGTEAGFTTAVIAYARLMGWKAHHQRPARTRDGWRTAVSGDGKGFLDLVLCRERVVFAELKTDRGRLTPEQKMWVGWLTAAGQEVHVWRPENWPEIERVLGRLP